MQEQVQHEALRVNTRVGLSVESRNKAVNRLHVKSSEEACILRIEQEAIVVKISALQVMKKFGPNHLGDHAADPFSVRFHCKLSLARCIQHFAPCPHQCLVRRALYNDDVATLASREFACNSLCATPPRTAEYGTGGSYAMLALLSSKEQGTIPTRLPPFAPG